jgi:hypothetical protein
MDTYEVKIEPYQLKLEHKVIGGVAWFLLYVPLFLLVRFGFGVLFPAVTERHKAFDRLAADGAVAFVIWIFVWLLISSIASQPDGDKRRDFKIAVEADSIAAVYSKTRRLVHKLTV